MAIPVYTVVHLQMRRSDKIALLCLIFLAILVTLASTIRLYYLVHVEELQDFTGSMPPVIFVSAFEGNLGIIVASIPSIRPLWTRCKTRRRVASHRKENSSSAQGADTLLRESRSGQYDADGFAVIQLDSVASSLRLDLDMPVATAVSVNERLEERHRE
ncbi:hypothetical protein PFICI_13635 [Pestalotiopsis fici W106-1]|uniref:Rhodopsin domain-containing protein n=1 Tax=Pestalotiopsis fici (strain W106-1 / CGMCC3.15140) TaxID=1229662 RepID=W3WQP6_PESFW|nr:uncharacterized protein PFICI_13635 [Pestalotiopsis fici W106-1]ETS75151.1 hypothetical protein PFICI_13635 [Pestalotiopsis fici W106-1]